MPPWIFPAPSQPFSLNSPEHLGASGQGPHFVLLLDVSVVVVDAADVADDAAVVSEKSRVGVALAHRQWSASLLP